MNTFFTITVIILAAAPLGLEGWSPLQQVYKPNELDKGFNIFSQMPNRQAVLYNSTSGRAALIRFGSNYANNFERCYFDGFESGIDAMNVGAVNSGRRLFFTYKSSGLIRIYKTTRVSNSWSSGNCPFNLVFENTKDIDSTFAQTPLSGYTHITIATYAENRNYLAIWLYNVTSGDAKFIPFSYSNSGTAGVQDIDLNSFARTGTVLTSAWGSGYNTLASIHPSSNLCEQQDTLVSFRPSTNTISLEELLIYPPKMTHKYGEQWTAGWTHNSLFKTVSTIISYKRATGRIDLDEVGVKCSDGLKITNKLKEEEVQSGYDAVIGFDQVYQSAIYSNYWYVVMLYGKVNGDVVWYYTQF